MLHFEDFFYPGKQKKSLRQDQVNREDGAWRSCRFGSRTAEQSVHCGRVRLSIPHHEMGKHIESLQKNSLKLNAASHNNASWYTDTDELRECSPSGGRLYY